MTRTMTMMNSKENRIQMPRWIKSDRLGQKVRTDARPSDATDISVSSFSSLSLSLFKQWCNMYKSFFFPFTWKCIEQCFSFYFDWKVYSITDLQLTTCADEEHSSMFANTLNKFFVRVSEWRRWTKGITKHFFKKRSHHSTLDLTRETSNEIHLIQSIGQGRFGIGKKNVRRFRKSSHFLLLLLLCLVFKALYHIRSNESVSRIRKNRRISIELITFSWSLP